MSADNTLVTQAHRDAMAAAEASIAKIFDGFVILALIHDIEGNREQVISRSNGGYALADGMIEEFRRERLVDAITDRLK